MKSPLSWYELRWPRETNADQLNAVFGILATGARGPCVLEATTGPVAVIHRLGLPGPDFGGLLAQLRAVLPGLALIPVTRPPITVHRAAEVRLSSRARALRTDDPEQVVRSVLTALAHVGKDELLILQWILGRPLAPAVVSRDARHAGDSPLLAVLGAAFGREKPVDNEARTALRTKRGEPGWRVIGRLGVQAAATSRQRQLLSRLIGALRMAQAPGVTLRTQWISRSSISHATPSWRYPTRLNLSELVTVAAWPIGMTNALPVASAGSRPLAPSRQIPRLGRILGVASYPGHERPVALSASDSLLHTHVLGPTGTGKSTLLINLVLQDMEAGRGALVLDPKGDFYIDLILRAPAHRLTDLVLLDPTDPSPVGLNPLSGTARSPELVADQLLSVFHGLYAAHWGPRTQDILHAALLSLAQFPGATLAALPLVLSDPGFRHRVVANIDDPIALGPFWAAYENWSDAERTSATAPVLNKLRPFLLRRQLRAVIGQRSPRFAIQQIFSERKVLVVNLAKGILGPEASAVLGALIISQFWQATLERAAVPPERRHPVFVYLDEFSDYLHLGTDLSDALSQARGLGAGLVLAHQFLHQLDPAMRSAVLANARSKVCLRLASEDARVMANGGGEPAAEDFGSLAAYQCYLQLVSRGTVQPWCSAQTAPLPKPANDPLAIRAASANRYGIPREDTEADLRAMVFGPRPEGDDLVPRRRGGAS